MDNDLAADEVETVTIYSLARAADILADPSKYDPRTKETADHSLPYVIAAAVADRQVTPLQFTDAKIMDEKIRAQLPKVKVIADPEIEAVFPELQRVRVVIRTTDGREVDKRTRLPQGRSSQSADQRRDLGQVQGPRRGHRHRRRRRADAGGDQSDGGVRRCTGVDGTVDSVHRDRSDHESSAGRRWDGSQARNFVRGEQSWSQAPSRDGKDRRAKECHRRSLRR